MSENGLICDSCHAKAEETDTECWNCGHTTFVYEPGNAKNQTPHSNNTPQQPDCYCVCHSPTSSCPACEHCKGQYLKTEQLREAFQLIIEEIVMQGATYADSKDGLRDKNYVRAEKKAFRDLLALFQKEQIQLVSELEEELPKPQIQLMGKLCDTCGDYMDYCNCARVQSSLLDQLTSWLEHKKQELEGGK